MVKTPSSPEEDKAIQEFEKAYNSGKLNEYFNDLLSTGEFQSTFRKDDTGISPEELAKREKSREKTLKTLETNINKIADTFDKVQSDLESNVIYAKGLPNKIRRFIK